MSETEAKTTRPYRMRARAKAAAATGQKILDAAEAVFDERPIDEFTLAEVAERAGVTVQTVIRRFGSRKGLIAATLVHVGVKMGKDRSSPTDDPRTEVDVLVDHYERFGDRILRLLRRGGSQPGAACDDRLRAHPAPALVRTGLRRRRSRGCAASSASGGSPSSWRSPTSTCGSCCAATAS